MIEMGKLVQKGIRFPQDVIDVIEAKARRTLGLEFNEYVKLLVMSEALEIIRKREKEAFVIPPDEEWLTGEVEQATPELEKSINESMEDFKAGRYTTLSSPNEVEDYFNKLNIKVNGRLSVNPYKKVYKKSK